MGRSNRQVQIELLEGLDRRNTVDQQKRLRLLLVAFLLAFTAIFSRLALLHLSPGNKLTDEEQLHIGRIQLTEPRGLIFDRNGVVLATNRLVPSVWVDPRKVGDAGALADYLAGRLGLPREEVLAKLARTDDAGKIRKFNMIKRWVDGLTEKDIEEIRAFSGGAVSAVMEPVRSYPQKDSAAHVLGFVNKSGEAGEGVELAFDKHLAAKAGLVEARTDTQPEGKRNILPSATVRVVEPEGGDLLQLTLDVNIQHSLESALDRRMEETQSRAAMGLVMDPRTGAILAMATRPAFDPNNYSSTPAELRKNRAVVDVFEPGSAFKIVTASAVLEHGLVTPETMIDCEGGAFNPYGHRIRDVHKYGVIPFSKCFEESSNIAHIKVAAMLGPERLEEWIRRYGFAQKTSQDFALESRGIFRSRDKWSKLSMGSLPMGQEVAVTMPQLARAFAVIANGGSLVEPYYVERAVARDGRVTYQHAHKPPVRILSQGTAKIMQELCHLVVLRGTGTAANIMDYRAGGKTGTAQMKRLDGKGYDKDRYTTVFAGFAPVSNPRLVAVIVVQEPKIKLRYGGYVCCPVFKEVVGEALATMNVPKDPVTDPEVVAAHEKELKLAAAKNKKPEAEKAKAKKPEPPAEEDDVDTVAPPADPATIDESLEALITPLDGLELVARRTGDRMETSMPDLIGLTKRQAREKLQRLGMPLDADGVGWVIAQDPPAGTALADVAVCVLKFGRKCEMVAEEQTGKDAADEPDKGKTM